MRITVLLIIVFLISCDILPSSIIQHSKAESSVTVVHGDQIILILHNNGLAEIDHTILFTSNKTISGVLIEKQSFDGTLIGEPILIADSSIEHSEVSWKTEGGITKFNITVNATLEPQKFKAVRLSYTLRDLLKFDNNSWFFNRVFTMSADAIAPPEVVIKVPKPSQFEDLEFHEIVPFPAVFLEEGPYYVLTWKSSTATFGNVTETLVRLRYSSQFNFVKTFLWLTPTLVSISVGVILTRLWDNRSRLLRWIQKRLKSREKGKSAEKEG